MANEWLRRLVAGRPTNLDTHTKKLPDPVEPKKEVPVAKKKLSKKAGIKKCEREGCTNRFDVAEKGRKRRFCSDACRKRVARDG